MLGTALQSPTFLYGANDDDITAVCPWGLVVYGRFCLQAAKNKGCNHLVASFILKPSLVCLRFNLFNTSLLTCKSTQVVKFSTTNTTELVNSDAVNRW